MNGRKKALAAGFGLALGGMITSGAALADDCGSPRTFDHCTEGAACGVMYVPYFNAHQDVPQLRQVTVTGPTSRTLELPEITAIRPKSECLAYFLPVGTYEVRATFANGWTARRANVQVRELRTVVTCPQVSVNLKRREVTQDPILCRGLTRVPM